MERIGNDTAGFTIDFDAASRAVRVRAWGFWDTDVAASFDTVVGGACRGRGSGLQLVMDMTELKPMREEGQRAFGSLVGRLRALGITSATVTTASQLTRLQLLRLANERGEKDTIRIT
jgi:hypothetical protein